MSPRAPALSPDDRRAQIVAAALPLVREHGKDVTTKQIAAAAGIAEGTIFRVFDDKQAVLEAVVLDVLSPEPYLDDLDALDLDRPLEAVLTDLVLMMSPRVTEIFEVIMRVQWMPQHVIDPRSQHDPIEAKIVAIFERFAEQLSLPPEKAADALRLLIFASRHPLINEGRPLGDADIIQVVLGGIRVPEPSGTRRTQRSGNTRTTRTTRTTQPRAKRT